MASSKHRPQTQAAPPDGSPPLVSIVIPSYNHAHYLSQAIDSALRQTHPAVEIIVVDDGSTDHTGEVVAGYPTVRYLHQSNAGLSHARNAGFAASRGDYLLFLDADDRLLPHAVERNLALLASSPHCAFAYGGAYYVDGAITRRDLHCFPLGLTDRIFPRLLEVNFLANPAMVLFQRWTLSKLGGFTVGLDASADYDMYLRASWHYPVVGHHEPIVEYRRHADNMSNNPCLMLEHTLAVLKRHRARAAQHRSTLECYRKGVREWRQFYGEQIVMEFHKCLEAGNLRQCARCLTTLARLHPKRLAQPGATLVHKLKRRYSSDAA